MRYLDNLVRGFHIGVKGYLSSEYDYRLLFSTRKAYGTAFRAPILLPFIHPAVKTWEAPITIARHA